VCSELPAGRTGLCVLQYRPVSLSPLPSGFDRERSCAPSRLCDDSRAVAAESTRGGRAHTETSQAEPPAPGPSRRIEAGKWKPPEPSLAPRCESVRVDSALESDTITRSPRRLQRQPRLNSL